MLALHLWTSSGACDSNAHGSWNSSAPNGCCELLLGYRSCVPVLPTKPNVSNQQMTKGYTVQHLWTRLTANHADDATVWHGLMPRLVVQENRLVCRERGIATMYSGISRCMCLPAHDVNEMELACSVP